MRSWDRIIKYTPYFNNSEIRNNNDEILLSKDADETTPQYFKIKSGKYKGKTICINRFNIKN